MKLKSKLMAAAIALVAASGAHATIDGTNTDAGGELFFNIWDDAGSYTRDLNITMNAFEASFAGTSAAPGFNGLSFAADQTFLSFMTGAIGGARSGTLQWNIVAGDNVNARRILSTVDSTVALPAQNSQADVLRTGVSNLNDFATAVNVVMGANQSVVAVSSDAWFAGKTTFGNKINNKMNFDTTGVMSNDTYDQLGLNGALAFQKTTFGATGITKGVNTAYLDDGFAVKAWIGNGEMSPAGFMNVDDTLYLGYTVDAVAAIPEPSEYALMLAGLGMLGFMARRRLNNRV